MTWRPLPGRVHEGTIMAANCKSFHKLAAGLLLLAVPLLAGCASSATPLAVLIATPTAGAAGDPAPPPTHTPSRTPAASLTPIPTATSTLTGTPSPTPTRTASSTASPTHTASPFPAPSPTPVPVQATARAVVLVVIDGARWSETFGAPGRPHIPHLANDLAPLGSLNNAVYNDGQTLSVPGHAAIVSGTWQDLPNDGSIRPTAPTLFEYLRAAAGAPPTQAIFVHGSYIEPVLTHSTHPDYGPELAAHMLFSDEPAPPYDDGMLANARQALRQLKPRLLVISLLDPDEAAHLGDWEGYLQAIRHDDEIIWDVWQQLQADPFYAGQTVLIVTNDHGRGCGNGWPDHGGSDDCNRHVMFLAVGPGIRAGQAIAQRRTLRDIAPTIGHLLGFDTPFATGQLMTEILRP